MKLYDASKRVPTAALEPGERVLAAVECQTMSAAMAQASYAHPAGAIVAGLKGAAKGAVNAAAEAIRGPTMASRVPPLRLILAITDRRCIMFVNTGVIRARRQVACSFTPIDIVEMSVKRRALLGLTLQFSDGSAKTLWLTGFQGAASELKEACAAWVDMRARIGRVRGTDSESVAKAA